jgi:hypothetical protein
LPQSFYFVVAGRRFIWTQLLTAGEMVDLIVQ